MPTTAQLPFDALNDALKAAGEETRLRVLALLAEGELTVSVQNAVHPDRVSFFVVSPNGTATPLGDGGSATWDTTQGPDGYDSERTCKDVGSVVHGSVDPIPLCTRQP